MKHFTFILIFFLGISTLFSQTKDTLKVKDTIPKPIPPEREAKNKAFYEQLKERFERHKATKDLTNLIEIDSPQDSVKKQQKTKPEAPNYGAYQGKIIRKITITTLDPFGFDERDLSKQPQKKLERYGNALHVKTREGTVRKFLLFKKNQPMDTLLLKETERVLRNQRYVRRALVQPVEVGQASDSVDIQVNVLDSWSLYFDGDLTDSRGWTRLTEQNLLGLGHEAYVTYRQYFSKFSDNGKGFGYVWRNIQNTYINLRTSYYTDYENFYDKSLAAERPLYSPLARWAGRIGYFENRYQDQSIIHSDSIYTPVLGTKTFDIFGSVVFPIKTTRNKDINTFIISTRFQNTYFFEKPAAIFDPEEYYANQDLVLTQLSLKRTNFKKARYIFRNGDVEDVGVGHTLFMTSGALRKLGSTLPYFALGYSHARYADKGYYALNVEGGTFLKDKQLSQTVLRLEATLFSNLFTLGDWHFRQFFRSKIVVGFSRNENNRDRINLNGDNGILGFSSTRVYGTRKLVLSSQTQVYAPFQFIGFRFSPFLSADLAFIGQKETVFPQADMYSRLSIGFYISNDYLPFGAIQFSFGYYPRIPGSGNQIFKFTGVTNDDFRLQSFNYQAPYLVPYR